MRILVLTKRQYMNKDLIDDRFGRFREIPLALAERGHVVKGLCLSYARRDEGMVKDGPVLWQSVNATSFKAPGLIKFLFHARKLAKRADIVWACSDSIYGIMGYGLSKKYKIPLVFDLYDNFEYFLMASLPIVKQTYRHVVKNCDAITCVSQPLKRLILSYGRKKHTIVLENAVSKELFLPLDKEKCRKKLKLPLNVQLMGTAGALESNRGIEILFDAFNMIKNKYKDLHLAVAGPRNVKIPQGTRIHDLGILPLETVPAFLNALDIGVVCNLENDFGKYCFPQKTREKMACDIPIIAAKVGSMQELFADRPEWLYEPGDSGSLARAIEYRLMDRHTNYDALPSWSELTDRLEDELLKITASKK
jgi:glycosyltransferase involved in cell wall biosynthesis